MFVVDNANINLYVIWKIHPCQSTDQTPVMPSQMFLRSSKYLIPSGSLLQDTSKAKNINPSEATFDVPFVDLLLVQFVVYLALLSKS